MTTLILPLFFAITFTSILYDIITCHSETNITERNLLDISTMCNDEDRLYCDKEKID